MSLSTTSASTTVQPVENASNKNGQDFLPVSDAGLLVLGAFAGVALTKSARKQYRKLMRKAAWSMLGFKVRSFLGLKQKQSTDGIDWLLLLLIVLGVAIGTALFGLLGFLILLGIGVIIYLLLEKN